MTTDCILVSCDHCDYKSKWKCNVTRHMMRKHVTDNVSHITENVSPITENVSPITENVSHITENVSPIIEYTNQCKDCKKIFKRRQNLLYHIPRCKGNTDKLTCEFCKAVFIYRSSKSKHMRICKEKLENDMKVVVTNTNTHLDANTNTNTKDISTKDISTKQVNQITQNVNIINNNVTINNNIIVYDPSRMELLNDHISKQDFRKMTHHHDFSKILIDYSTALLSRPENQCVRKTNLRSTSSAVHVGNDNWEYHSDKQVLPKLLANIADNFGDVKEAYKVDIYKQLETFMIDVTCEAEDCHTDEKEEARLKALYKRAVTNIKHLLFNLTKQTLLEKRKNKILMQ